MEQTDPDFMLNLREDVFLLSDEDKERLRSNNKLQSLLKSKRLRKDLEIVDTANDRRTALRTLRSKNKEFNEVAEFIHDIVKKYVWSITLLNSPMKNLAIVWTTYCMYPYLPWTMISSIFVANKGEWWYAVFGIALTVPRMTATVLILLCIFCWIYKKQDDSFYWVYKRLICKIAHVMLKSIQVNFGAITWYQFRINLVVVRWADIN